MSHKARRLDYSPDEYVAGVGGVLSFAEQGVYWMVCTLVMSSGGPIPEDVDRLAHLGKMRRPQVKAILDSLVERGKLHRSDGQIVNNRAANEVQRAEKRIATASENGAKGGRPPKKTEGKQRPTEPGGFSGEKLTTNDQPPTTNAVPIGTAPPPRNPTDAIVQVFDAVLVECFGPAQARLCPAGTDRTNAERWVQAGADARLARGVFEARMRVMAERGDRPPSTLSYFDNPVADALRARARPMPEGQTPTARAGPPSVMEAGRRAAARLAEGDHG